MPNDFQEDGLNRMKGYRGSGGNKLGLRDSEDEIVVMPHNSPGARGHIINSIAVATTAKVDPRGKNDEDN